MIMNTIFHSIAFVAVAHSAISSPDSRIRIMDDRGLRGEGIVVVEDCGWCLLIPILIILVPDKIKFGDAVLINNVQGCQGEGICVIDWGISVGSGPFATEEAPDNATLIVASNQNGQMVIACRDTRQHPELSGNTFTMDGDYTIPSDIANALRISSYTIAAGRYSIERIGEVAFVVF